jgi:hypothetical protein
MVDLKKHIDSIDKLTSDIVERIERWDNNNVEDLVQMIHEDVELETTHSGNRYALFIVWQISYFLDTEISDQAINLKISESQSLTMRLDGLIEGTQSRTISVLYGGHMSTLWLTVETQES